MRFWDWLMVRWGGRRHAPNSASASLLARHSSHGSVPTSASSTATAVLDQEPPDSGDKARWWIPAEAPLLALVSARRPELTAEARAIENLLILHFDGRNLSLPPLPQVPETVLRILGSAHWSMKQVAEEVGRDQVAAAAVLQMANSPLYRGLQKITSIEPALVRLGCNSIRTAMMNLSMRSVLFREHRAGRQRLHTLWRRALASAIIMRSLSRFTGLDPEEAFLIGLMHDIGDIIVLRIAHAERVSAELVVDDDTFEYLCQEAHEEFGELLADAWSLPARLKALITDHHNYPSDNQPFRTERLQLQLTDMICALLGFAPYGPYNLEECQPARDLGLLQRSEYVPYLTALVPDLDETLTALE